MHKLGAHVSVAGGFVKTLEKLEAMGGNTLQIFSASPRIWQFARPNEHDINEFKTEAKKRQIATVYYHASYLINLADTARVGQLSRQLLVHELKLGHTMSIRGSIIHLGSYSTNGNNDTHLCENIARILEKVPDDVLFIVENAGNRKIGLRIEEIGDIVKSLKDKRVKVCLDTCHLHAAGYSLGTPKNFENFLDDFDTKVGLERLEVWHLNDSKDPNGSYRDRHENIGEGQVGKDVFAHILNHPRTRKHSMIIETPGFDDRGPDKKNLDILKSLIS